MSDLKIPETCSTTDYRGSERELLTCPKNKEILNFNHRSVESQPVFFSWLWSQALALEPAHEWLLFSPWMLAPIHQPLILQDSGAPHSFALAVGFRGCNCLMHPQAYFYCISADSCWTRGDFPERCHHIWGKLLGKPKWEMVADKQPFR